MRMLELEPQRVAITPKLEEVLAPREAEVMQAAEQAALPCPDCGQPLRADMVVSRDYEGVVLSCPDRGGCGFREC